MSIIIQHLQTRILTHFACRASDKISVICQTIIHSFESAGKMCDSWRHLLLVNDVIHGVRRCNVVLRLKDVTNTCKRMRRGLSIGGSSSVQRREVGRSWRLQICFRRLLCIKIEIDQLQCVICCVLSTYDMIISHALESRTRTEKTARSLILVTNVHWQARASQWIWQYIDWPRERSKPMKIGHFT